MNKIIPVKSMIKLFSFLSARLGEASTYAGFSALCVALASAFSLSGPARAIALLGSVAAAVGAIAKSEKNATLSAAMEQAVELVPVLTKTVEAVEEAFSANRHLTS